MSKRAFFLCALALLTGCSASQIGLDHLNAGRHSQALSVFQKCAAAGDPYCINNLGYMYERGLVTGTPDRAKAAEYFTLAARMGLPLARQNLIQLGYPVPSNDLEASYQARLEREAAERKALGRALLQAAQGPAYQPPPQAPQPSYAPPTYGSGSGSQATIVPANCTGDSQCGAGRICVKPANSFAKGICVQPVDDLGMRSLAIPGPSVGPHEVPGCEFFDDCPLGFRCVKQSGQMHGLCMK